MNGRVGRGLESERKIGIVPGHAQKAQHDLEPAPEAFDIGKQFFRPDVEALEVRETFSH